MGHHGVRYKPLTLELLHRLRAGQAAYDLGLEVARGVDFRQTRWRLGLVADEPHARQAPALDAQRHDGVSLAHQFAGHVHELAGRISVDEQKRPLRHRVAVRVDADIAPSMSRTMSSGAVPARECRRSNASSCS